MSRSAIRPIVEDLLERLDGIDVRGTFFVVGTLAEAEPRSGPRHRGGRSRAGAARLGPHPARPFRPRHTAGHGSQGPEPCWGSSPARRSLGYRAATFSLTPSHDLGHRRAGRGRASPTRPACWPAANPLYGYPGAPRHAFRWPSGLVELPVPLTASGRRSSRWAAPTCELLPAALSCAGRAGADRRPVRLLPPVRLRPRRAVLVGAGRRPARPRCCGSAASDCGQDRPRCWPTPAPPLADRVVEPHGPPDLRRRVRADCRRSTCCTASRTPRASTERLPRDLAARPLGDPRRVRRPGLSGHAGPHRELAARPPRRRGAPPRRPRPRRRPASPTRVPPASRPTRSTAAMPTAVAAAGVEPAEAGDRRRGDRAPRRSRAPSSTASTTSWRPGGRLVVTTPECRRACSTRSPPSATVRSTTPTTW